MFLLEHKFSSKPVQQPQGLEAAVYSPSPDILIGDRTWKKAGADTAT